MICVLNIKRVEKVSSNGNVYKCNVISLLKENSEIVYNDFKYLLNDDFVISDMVVNVDYKDGRYKIRELDLPIDWRCNLQLNYWRSKYDDK